MPRPSKLLEASGAAPIAPRTGTASITTPTSTTHRTSGAPTTTAAPKTCTTAIRPRCGSRSTTIGGTTTTRKAGGTTRATTSFWMCSRAATNLRSLPGDALATEPVQDLCRLFELVQREPFVVGVGLREEAGTEDDRGNPGCRDERRVGPG